MRVCSRSPTAIHGEEEKCHGEGGESHVAMVQEWQFWVARRGGVSAHGFRRRSARQGGAVLGCVGEWLATAAIVGVWWRKGAVFGEGMEEWGTVDAWSYNSFLVKKGYFST